MIHNPSGLYSENQGIFNSTPYTQFALNQQAKQDAKDEALDKYYQDLPKSINGAGVRTQDVGGFMDKINGIRQYYAQNRDAIKNPRLDRGKAQSTYQSMNVDASQFVNQSKQEELKKQPFVKILANPDQRQRVLKSDLDKLALHDLPLNDPRRKSFDFSTIDFNPKEFTPNEIATYQKGLSGGFQPSENIVSSVPNSKDLTIMNTYQKKWAPEQLKAMADKDISNVLSNRQFEYQAQKAWDKVKDNPEQFKQYNDIYKGIYGKDIEHPEELHAAMQVGGVLGESTRQEIKPDENARDKRNFTQQKIIQDRGFTHTEKMAKDKLGVGDNVNINDIFKNIQDATDNHNAAIIQNGTRVGTRVNTLNSDAQKVLVDYANKLRPNEKIGNDNIFINKEADGTIKLYRTEDTLDSDGKTVTEKAVKKDDAHLIGELPKVTVNIPAQPGVKEKRAVIAAGNEGVPAKKKITDPALLKLLNKK